VDGTVPKPAVQPVEQDENRTPGAPANGETVRTSAVRRVAPVAAVRRIGPPENAPDPQADPEAKPRHPTVEAVLADLGAYFEGEGAEPFGAPDEAFLTESFFDFAYLERYEEVDRRWVSEPFAYVSVLYDPEVNEFRYHVTEPQLDRFERYVRSDLVTLLRNELIYLDFEPGNREQVFLDQARELVNEHAATVDPGTLHKVLYYLRRDFLGYGPVDPIMGDPGIEDISCDGTEVPVYVYHREFRDLASNVSFSERRLNSFVVQLAQRAGRSISISSPLIDASLPDGSRIQLTMGGDVSTRGGNFTIRKFADVPYTPVDLIEWNTFSAAELAYFWLAIENNKSLIFAGGTGSGKTTSMNAISFFIPRHSKVVTIEDTREIDLPHQNWIPSVTRSSASGEGRGEVTMYNLLQAALRQRPEYIVVGEIRTEQNVAFTFFQAMGTGHTAYTTVHADSVETALSRLQNPPLSVPTQMLQDLDIVSIQRQTFLGDRRVRRTGTVAELSGDQHDPGRVDWDVIFEWDPTEDEHRQVGDSGVLGEIAHDRGWSVEELRTEFAGRVRVLEYLVDEGYRGYAEVARAIQAYARSPEGVLDAIEAGTFDPSEVGLAVAMPPRASIHDALASETELDEPPIGAGTPPALDEATYRDVLAAAEADADARAVDPAADEGSPAGADPTDTGPRADGDGGAAEER
jgi:flagellar protein FlaI